MRRIKDEFQQLDYVFKNASNVTDAISLEVIAASYETAKTEKPFAAELARRRYREREHRHKTCRQLFISEAQYYKLLSSFLRIAKNVEEKILRDQTETPPAT